MKPQKIIRALAAALVLSALNLTVAGATDATDDINPADFTVTIDNPFFPLSPGITFIYRGKREGLKQRDEFAITDGTLVIDGVTCRVVHDRVFERGLLRENTLTISHRTGTEMSGILGRTPRNSINTAMS